MNRSVAAAIVLMGVGAAFSGRRWVAEPRPAPSAAGVVAPVCSETADTVGAGCIRSSRLSSVAGVPLASLALGFYVSVGALLLLAALGGGGLRHRAAGIAFRLLAVGVMVDVALLAAHLVIERRVPALSLATYGSTLLGAIVLFPHGREPGPADPSERRLLYGGWALAIAATFVALTVGESLLRQKARVQDLKATLDDPARREFYLQERAVARFQQMPVVEFELSHAPHFGPAAAPVTVVEFVDFLCPVCQSLSTGLEEFLAQSHGRVAWYFKNSPLDTACNPTLPQNLHPGACWMARGAVCAHEAGRFAEFHWAAFAAPPQNPGPAEVVRLGAHIGLDPTSYGRCIISPTTEALVAADIADARRGASQGTPTLFINGRRAPLWTYVERLVAAESDRLGLAVRAPAGNSAR